MLMRPCARERAGESKECNTRAERCCTARPHCWPPTFFSAACLPGSTNSVIRQFVELIRDPSRATVCNGDAARARFRGRQRCAGCRLEGLGAKRPRTRPRIFAACERPPTLRQTQSLYLPSLYLPSLSLSRLLVAPTKYVQYTLTAWRPGAGSRPPACPAPPSRGSPSPWSCCTCRGAGPPRCRTARTWTAAAPGRRQCPP
jgi:hypothetical protein